MAKKPKAQPQQKGQSKSNTFRPILRQKKVEVIAAAYFNGFELFQDQNPKSLPGILQPKFDRLFYRKHLTLTKKTHRPIWKKL